MSAVLKSLAHPLVGFFLQADPIDTNTSAYQAGVWLGRIFIALFVIVIIYTLYQRTRK